jgi:RimJ/RimL family protein N-acetyltransferase
MQRFEAPLVVLNELFVLDRPRHEDAAAARHMALDPDTARFFGWTIEQARAQPDSHYEEGIRRFAREWSDGTRFSLTIRRRSDREPVGSVELRPRPEVTAKLMCRTWSPPNYEDRAWPLWPSKPCWRGGSGDLGYAVRILLAMLKTRRRAALPRSAGSCWLIEATTNCGSLGT